MSTENKFKQPLLPSLGSPEASRIETLGALSPFTCFSGPILVSGSDFSLAPPLTAFRDAGLHPNCPSVPQCFIPPLRKGPFFDTAFPSVGYT